MVNGQQATEAQANQAEEAIKETVHLHDGVIHRQIWHKGQLARQDDLNADGKPIRRLTYEAGKLAKREYLDRDGNLVSTERFDGDGYMTYSAGQRSYSRNQPAWKRDSTGFSEWWYERGVPVKYRRGATSLAKEGDRWVVKP
jgi:hypothetical protein